MSYPFFKHPSLEEYLDDVIELGCTISTIIDQETGLKLMKIETANGNRVVSALSLNEALSPNIIKNYDSRLGIKSRWFQFTHHIDLR